MKLRINLQGTLIAGLAIFTLFSAGCGGSGGGTVTPPPSQIPLAPSSFSAVPGKNSIALSWTPSAGATTYNIFRGLSAGAESTTALAIGVTGRVYTDLGLTNGTTYFYEIVAVNSFGTSGLSGEASATPTTVPPPAPAGLNASPGNGQVVMSWTLDGAATSYNVFRGTVSGGEGTTAIATNIRSTSFADTTVINGITYYYKISAQNSIGTSVLSNEALATPGTASTVPLPPIGLTATAGAGQVALSWFAQVGATSYNVYRGAASGAESPTPIATGITAASFTNTGLANGTTYFYQVTAVNSFGVSGGSNEAFATPSAAASVPAVPAGLTATPGSMQVALSWAASSGATSYSLFRGTSAGGESATPVATGIIGTSVTDTNLTNGTAYFYTVQAVNAIGTSASSNEASAIPTTNVAPAAPTSLSALSSSGQVTLNWLGSPGAASYTVLRSLTSGSGYTTRALGVLTTTFIDGSVITGTPYYYVVTATNTFGTSGPSNEATSTP